MSDPLDPMKLAREATLARKAFVEREALLSEDPFVVGPSSPALGGYTPRLYFELSSVSHSLQEIGRNDSTQVPSTIPIVGKVIDQLKSALHEIALNYVRRLAVRQMALNVSFARVLNEIVASTAPGAETHGVSLAARVEHLEARVAELESALSRRS